MAVMIAATVMGLLGIAMSPWVLAVLALIAVAFALPAAGAADSTVNQATAGGMRFRVGVATGEAIDRLREALVPLQGVALAPEVWERDVLPRRLGAYSAAWVGDAGLVTRTENFDGCSRTLGMSISPRRSISLIHCLGLRIAFT